MMDEFITVFTFGAVIGAVMGACVAVLALILWDTKPEDAKKGQWPT